MRRKACAPRLQNKCRKDKGGIFMVLSCIVLTALGYLFGRMIQKNNGESHINEGYYVFR